MATFTIDSENNITGYASGEAVPDNDSERFTTEGSGRAVKECLPHSNKERCGD
jgi:hypothetical protein